MKKQVLPLLAYLLGHEFNSLVLAILQVSGRAPKEKQSIIDQIKGLEGPFHFETFVSLTCQKCPDVVQALNLMSVINLTLLIL